MVRRHRSPCRSQDVARRFLVTIVPRLWHEGCLVQQLIALKGPFFIPCSFAQAEGNGCTLPTQSPLLQCPACLCPFQHPVGDSLPGGGIAGAPVLPWKIFVPAAPCGASCACRPRFLDKGQIGQREGTAALVRAAARQRPVAITKSVELLDIAERLL